MNFHPAQRWLSQECHLHFHGWPPWERRLRRSNTTRLWVLSMFEVHHRHILRCELPSPLNPITRNSNPCTGRPRYTISARLAPATPIRGLLITRTRPGKATTLLSLGRKHQGPQRTRRPRLHSTTLSDLLRQRATMAVLATRNTTSPPHRRKRIGSRHNKGRMVSINDHRTLNLTTTMLLSRLRLAPDRL